MATTGGHSGPESESNEVALPPDLTDDDYLLADSVVYGFSFSDKQWCTCFVIITTHLIFADLFD